MPPDPWDNLRLDYERTLEYFHALRDSRFKLLALLPVVTGAVLGTADVRQSPQRNLALGIFGFLVSLGLTFYEVRNTQIYDAIQIRAKSLEAFLGFARAGNRKSERSGPMLQRPERTRNLFGIISIWHDRALAIVYATTIAAWSYLVIAALVELLAFRNIFVRQLLWAVPLSTWIAFVVQLHRYDTPTDVAKAYPPEVRFLLQQPSDEPWLNGIPDEARMSTKSTNTKR